METFLTYAPLIPWPAIWALAVLCAVVLVFCTWRGLTGWALRSLAALALLLGLAQPSLQSEERENLSNIVLVVLDYSASQTVSDRMQQVAKAQAYLTQKIGVLDDFEMRVVRVENDLSGRDHGTLLMQALRKATNEIAANRLAGAILVTDGQIHDVDDNWKFPAPLHVLLTGQAADWDRRLVIEDAPAFAILGEDVVLKLRIEDQGKVPSSVRGSAKISIAIDDNEPQEFRVQTNTDLELPVTVPHAGMNILQFKVHPTQGELTENNNSAVVSINGVRDRLRVLLVSGEPYAGERTWRNLLKSDSAVDLVHFTILRPPEKQDGVPVRELSLIAFPTRELFLEKVDEFDLIIFDRYSKRGLLPNAYLGSVVDYVKRGGAVLVATGPDFAGVNSLYRTPLADILPAEPTARVYERGFYPTISELGLRHPVTQGLGGVYEQGEQPWGRWFRHVDADAIAGDVVMNGVDGRPLLLLDRIEEGRIALLLSDQAWLWSRGFEGGGPQLELLRRLAHWMMKEPELEEEQLTATAVGQTVTIVRRSLALENHPVEIIAPDGATRSVILEETAAGHWIGNYDGALNGLYRMSDGILSTVFALGPASPKEFENTIASADLLTSVVRDTKGAVIPLHKMDHPDIRITRQGRTAGGERWLGLWSRNAYLTTAISSKPLLPNWVLLLLVGLISVAAWRVESR